jgi:hypothetical protein
MLLLAMADRRSRGDDWQALLWQALLLDGWEFIAQIAGPAVQVMTPTRSLHVGTAG